MENNSTKKCPSCGANMIEEQSPFVKASYPPIYTYEWACACGHREHSREERGTTIEDEFAKKWKEANPGKEFPVPAERSDVIKIEERDIDGTKTGEMKIFESWKEGAQPILIGGDRVQYRFNTEAIRKMNMDTIATRHILRDCVALLLDSAQIWRPEDGTMDTADQEELFQKLLKKGFVVKVVAKSFCPHFGVQHDPCPPGVTNNFVCKIDNKECEGEDDCRHPEWKEKDTDANED